MNKQEILVKKLIEKKYTISFAESCTGGKMAATIVDVADAS
ncbi:MAG: CinA family protein [Eubacterium ventriosum]